jgi:luciferase family oxidoreductase group 1
MSTVRFGVLDQAPVYPGETPVDAFNHSLELIRACETLGYHRYWVAEHHAMDTLACASPEILITRLASATTRIRVGSGGVLLPHYSPFKVAEWFRTLECLFPGRMDLGIGRAPGGDGRSAAALAYGSRIGVEYYPQKVADLTAFVSGERAPTEAFAALTATPRCATQPEMWVLASSPDSAELAARFGMGLCFAHFIVPQGAAKILREYRRQFRPGVLQAPYSAIGIFAICAEDAQEADVLRRMRELQKQRQRLGITGEPTREEALAQDFSRSELDAMRHQRSRRLIGTRDELRAEIDDLVEASAADEVIVLTNTPSFPDRLRSYALLAETFGPVDGRHPLQRTPV